jgi:hypothetical protein
MGAVDRIDIRGLQGECESVEGSVSPKTWTMEEQNRLIRAVRRGDTSVSIGAMLGRSEKSVESRRVLLIRQGLLSHSGRGPKVAKPSPPLQSTPTNAAIHMVFSTWERVGNGVLVRTVRAA